MASIQTQALSNPPQPATVNGELRWQRSTQVTSPGESQRRMIYANGMNNTPDAAMADALSLSGVIEGRILHLYNQAGDIAVPPTAWLILALKTAPFLNGIQIQRALPPPPPTTGNWLVDQAAQAAWQALAVQAGQIMLARDLIVKVVEGILKVRQFGNDIVQCVMDWANVLAALKGDAILGPVFQSNPRLAAQLMELYLGYNPPIRSLFLFLRDNMWDGEFVIAAHSQGNLITSAALHGLKVVQTPFPPRAITVFAIASPATNWVGEVAVRFYTNDSDLVPYLSLGTSFVSTTKSPASLGRPGVTFPGSHAVSTHLNSTALRKDLRIKFGLAAEPAIRMDTRRYAIRA